MNPLERARLEKALADHGFDLTPVLESDWQIGQSTLHPVAVRLRQNSGTSITLSTTDLDLQAAMLKEGLTCLSAFVVSCDGVYGRGSTKPSPRSLWRSSVRDRHRAGQPWGNWAGMHISQPRCVG